MEMESYSVSFGEGFHPRHVGSILFPGGFARAPPPRTPSTRVLMRLRIRSGSRSVQPHHKDSRRCQGVGKRRARAPSPHSVNPPQPASLDPSFDSSNQSNDESDPSPRSWGVGRARALPTTVAFRSHFDSCSNRFANERLEGTESGGGARRAERRARAPRAECLRKSGRRPGGQ